MKYSQNSLEFSHIMRENLKPIPMHHLKNTLLQQRSGRKILLPSLRLAIQHKNLMVNKYNLVVAWNCTLVVEVWHCQLQHAALNHDKFLANANNIYIQSNFTAAFTFSPILQPLTQKLWYRCMRRMSGTCPLN